MQVQIDFCKTIYIMSKIKMYFIGFFRFFIEFFLIISRIQLFNAQYNESNKFNYVDFISHLSAILEFFLNLKCIFS